MDVVAITPVYTEPANMIQNFSERVEETRRKLVEKGIGFRHFFLDDGAVHLADESSILVRHTSNSGLAQTLVDGYKAVLGLRSLPDVVVRLDCQEHDPAQILFAVDHLAHAPSLEALFLPVWYWVRGESRPAMREITQLLATFINALSPLSDENSKILESIYNQKFPLGYQVYRTETLRKVVPYLERGLELYQQKTGCSATWGIDLLAIITAGNLNRVGIDFVFGGWSEPWVENRGPEKVAAQREKARMMVEIAKELLDKSSS